ncbi:bacterio-opsin activator domain-containing protein [Natronomonas sp. EA1]|uniref:bacterio-opsin activator domain-containing protein n=1 Tax=Natronomonas sp. EA1 TaxID=3421655 RepID=UPI003EBDD3BD
MTINAGATGLSSEQLLRLLDSIPDLAYVLDDEGRLQWWNEQFTRVSDYDDAELSGMSAFSLIAEADHEALHEAMAAAETQPQTRTFDLVTADGEALTHEFSGAPLFEGEEFIGYVGVARDVTEREARARTLRNQRDELDTLVRVNEAMQDAIRSLTTAGTREELERTVCERLADSELYRTVWIGRNGDVEPSVGVGLSTLGELLDALKAHDEVSWDRPASRAVAENELVSVHRERSSVPEPIRALAREAGILTGAAIPLSHRGTVYGVLCVYTTRGDAFSDRELAAFERLSEVIGFAIHAVRTEQLLLSEPVVELEFEVTDEEAFFTGLTAREGGTLRIEWATPVGGGRVREFASVEGLSIETIREAAEADPHVTDFSVVSTDAQPVIAVTFARSVVRALLDAGANMTEAVITDGVGTLRAEVPRDASVREVVDGFLSVYDEATFVAKRVVERETTGDRWRFDDGLTEKQGNALETAYRSGYFEWPRERNAEEVAAELGVSSATFHYHLRRAQKGVFERLFDGGSLDS